MIDSKRYDAGDDDFTNVQGPGRRELEAIEEGLEPRRIRGVPSAAAVIDMYAEYVPEPVHHVGADSPVARAVGGLIL